MIDVPFKLGKPTIKKGKVPSNKISSIIEISGDVSGCVVISLAEEIALQLASALLDEELKELDGDCTDAIGEIANMIAGNAKTGFPAEKTSISVPTVVVGKYKVNYPSGLPIISRPCEVGPCRMVVDIAIKVKG